MPRSPAGTGPTTTSWAPRHRRRTIFKLKRNVYEARIEDLKEAHRAEREAMQVTITMLAEQVEYLRMMVGRPQPVRLQAHDLEPPAPHRGTPLHVTDEEEDVRQMHADGYLDVEELNSALRELGIDVEPD